MGIRFLLGGIDVSANDPGSSSGFLTCLNGGLLEGISCAKGAKDRFDLSNGSDMTIVCDPLETGDEGVSDAAAIDGIQFVAPPTALIRTN